MNILLTHVWARTCPSVPAPTSTNTKFHAATTNVYCHVDASFAVLVSTERTFTDISFPVTDSRVYHTTRATNCLLDDAVTQTASNPRTFEMPAANVTYTASQPKHLLPHCTRTSLHAPVSINKVMAKCDIFIRRANKMHRFFYHQ
jgi:hypothetical protein